MAIIYIIFINLHSLLFKPQSLYNDNLSKSLIYLSVFLGISGVFSVFYYKISILQVLVVLRTYIYILSYFIIRQLSVDEIWKIIKLLGIITFITCFIYCLQIPLNRHLLFSNDDIVNPNEIYGGIARFTNIPYFRNLFLLISVFSTQIIGSHIVIKRLVYFSSLLLALARTAILLIVFCIATGLVIQKKISLKWIFIGLIAITIIYSFLGNTFEKRNTSDDITLLLTGGYKDFENTYNEQTATLTYRIAWVYERLDYLSTRPLVESLFGLGYISDQDKNIYQRYNFRINEYGGSDNAQILYSFDIAWGNFITRFGLIGTVLFLSIWIRLALYFWKRRKNELNFSIFLYLLLLLIGSTSTQILSETSTLIPIFLFFVLSEKQGLQIQSKYN